MNSAKLNVTLVSHSPYTAGAEKMLANLAIGLTGSTTINPVVLIPNANRGPLGNLLSARNVQWRRSPPLRWYVYEPIQFASDYTKHVLEVASMYADLYWRQRTDVVIVNTLTSLCPAIGAILAGLPYVMWVHGVLDGGQATTHDLMKQTFDSILLKHARSVAYCSDWTRQYFETTVPGERAKTILNWTTVPKLDGSRARSSRICTLTTLEAHKGTEVLIRAIALLKSSGIPVGLDVYGDGPLRIWLEDLSKKLQVDDLAVFHGRTDRPEACLSRALAAVVPSIIEPFGMVAIEAMAIGTPVIASRAGGLPEIIEDGVSGLLFNAADHVDLASKIRELIEDTEKKDRIGAEGRNRVLALFDGRKSIAEFEETISDAANSFSQYSDDTFGDLDYLRLLSEIPMTTNSLVQSDDASLYELNEIKNSTYWRLGRVLREFGTKYPVLRRPFRTSADALSRKRT
ncbi:MULTISPECIES: glycosyltransferase family 4 protein [unclassified Mesorhizobium]|uniref:glycosyltransferase family 4 protein n=1 Tax=unclassified Mesorhizobium TaxID=325217 RepID=UPI000FCC46F9|nr:MULTISPECIES: glycosyltransferase family 4 protein [unclassified Mesorhizobium]RUX96612.1 glycosyltransferase family 1 protein [Mesorhizobium sp. M7D.F.Ca.US.004.01.2.1]RVA24281.1 glycosyltransferase family 1 protein [Mesorhizobium sp. M7D.F.Ca.US.004.03.1.1]